MNGHLVKVMGRHDFCFKACYLKGREIFNRMRSYFDNLLESKRRNAK